MENRWTVRFYPGIVEEEDERTFGEPSRERERGTKEKKTLDDVGFDRRSFVFPVTSRERERGGSLARVFHLETKISAATCRNPYRATVFSLSTRGGRGKLLLSVSREYSCPLARIFATRRRSRNTSRMERVSLGNTENALFDARNKISRIYRRGFQLPASRFHRSALSARALHRFIPRA